MRKVTNPTYHANDGTIFTDPLSAATHDARAAFEDIAGVHEFTEMQLLFLAKNWQNVLSVLTRLDAEYLRTTTPIDVVVSGVPEKVCYDPERGDFFTITADTSMGFEFRRRWISKRLDFPEFAPQGDNAAGPDGDTSADLGSAAPAPVLDPEWRNKSRDHPTHELFTLPGETDPRG